MLLRRMTFAAIAALACLFVANDAMAQRGGWGGGGRLEYLFNPQVQEELDLVEDQIESLRDVGDQSRDIMRNAFSGMREKFADMSREERDEMMTTIRAKITEDMKAIDEKVGELLVPHQLERLDQIVVQSKMTRDGTAAALGSDDVREKLGLTDEEVEALKKKQEEVTKKLEEKMKKLKEEARDEILSVLPADKQKSIKDMLGDAFEMQQQRGRRGGFGGGRGGGDRGGRGRGGRGGDRPNS